MKDVLLNYPCVMNTPTPIFVFKPSLCDFFEKIEKKPLARPDQVEKEKIPSKTKSDLAFAVDSGLGKRKRNHNGVSVDSSSFNENDFA